MRFGLPYSDPSTSSSSYLIIILQSMRFGLPYPDPSTSSSSSLIIILQSMRFGLPYSDPSTSSSSSLNPSIYAVWFTLSWSFIYSEDIFKSITYLRILNLKCPVHREQNIQRGIKRISRPEREFKVYKSCKCSQIICSRVH